MRPGVSRIATREHTAKLLSQAPAPWRQAACGSLGLTPTKLEIWKSSRETDVRAYAALHGYAACRASDALGERVQRLGHHGCLAWAALWDVGYGMRGPREAAATFRVTQAAARRWAEAAWDDPAAARRSVLARIGLSWLAGGIEEVAARPDPGPPGPLVTLAQRVGDVLDARGAAASRVASTSAELMRISYAARPSTRA